MEFIREGTGKCRPERKKGGDYNAAIASSALFPIKPVLNSAVYLNPFETMNILQKNLRQSHISAKDCQEPGGFRDGLRLNSSKANNYSFEGECFFVMSRNQATCMSIRPKTRDHCAMSADNAQARGGSEFGCQETEEPFCQ
jgi:hypothetical protein